MKYYITADIHGFYSESHKALDEAGYFTDLEPHKLIILGDLFNCGQEVGRCGASFSLFWSRAYPVIDLIPAMVF